MKTIMKEIPNCPGYFALTDGRIYSTRTNKGHGPGRFLKQCQLNRGHLIVRLFSKYNRKLVHRLILETFIGPCPEGMECRHLDGNPTNNHLSNLCWGSHQDNEADKDRMGRRPRGSKHGGSKLTEQDVRMIIYMCSTKLFSQRETADIYGVCIGTVNHIIKKRNWRQIWTSM